MSDAANRIDRLATLTLLASEQPGIGRTAIMKCAYFLQALKRVPLGYRFRLYTYGPYDSDVLQDLDYADRLGAVQIAQVSYSNGYGYSIRPGSNADDLLDRSSAFIAAHRSDISDIAKEFAGKAAVDLELHSAIVFVSMSFQPKESGSRLDEIVDHVRAIKPRFSDEEIRFAAQELAQSSYITI